MSLKTANEIEALIQSSVEPIEEMRKLSLSYLRNYSGQGLDEYLQIINSYENSTQHELRKLFSISNQWVVDELLRPTDNIWKARGGSVQIEGLDFSKREEKDKILNVRAGYTLRQYMKEIWFQRFVVDPNGIQYVEASTDGSKAYPTFKSIFSIMQFDRNGITFDWIAFEPHEVIITEPEDTKEEPKKIEMFWFVDKEYYYLVKRVDEEKYVVDNVIVNPFKEVPAITNSTIYDTTLMYYVSPIHKQIELLDSYVTKNSVKEIYQYLHNYPVFWHYESLCTTCQGKKKLDTGEVCKSCNGTGHSSKKDVSDVIVLQKPKEDQPSYAPPAGYVQTEIATMGDNRTELDWMFDKIFHSQWGTTVEKSDNETATGRFIDVQPVHNKLNSYADIAQTVESYILKLVAMFYSSTVKGASVSYGRRYMIETADQIWNRYELARKEQANKTVLDYFLEQFYLTEFANNEKHAEFYLKLMYVEPYVHSTYAEVKSLPVSDTVKDRKLYFAEWSKTLDFIEVNDKTEEQLISMLDEYIISVKPEEAVIEEPEAEYDEDGNIIPVDNNNLNTD